MTQVKGLVRSLGKRIHSFSPSLTIPRLVKATRIQYCDRQVGSSFELEQAQLNLQVEQLLVLVLQQELKWELKWVLEQEQFQGQSQLLGQIQELTQAQMPQGKKLELVQQQVQWVQVLFLQQVEPQVRHRLQLQ